MKHFKLKIEQNLIPVADLYLPQVLEKDRTTIANAFVHALKDSHIDFDIVIKEDQMLIAKKKEITWSISE